MGSGLYVARIIENASGAVVRESAPTYLRRAERIEDGMSINLNHELFSTEVVEIEPKVGLPEWEKGLLKSVETDA